MLKAFHRVAAQLKPGAQPMFLTFFRFVAVGGLVYLGLCVVLFFFQRNLIYLPRGRSTSEGATTITLRTDGAEIIITSRPHPGSKALIYFGGNAEDVSYSFPDLVDAFPDDALFLMHYRGYGGSSGKPTEEALCADALALFDKVHPEHPNVVVIGRSLGAAVAVKLASMRPVFRLVLVTPFESLQELAAQKFPFFPVRWLLQDKFESWKYAPQVSVPTLVVAAEHDEVVPRRSTLELLKHFPPGVASFKEIPGTSHNTISESAEYWPLLKGVR